MENLPGGIGPLLLDAAFRRLGLDQLDEEPSSTQVIRELGELLSQHHAKHVFEAVLGCATLRDFGQCGFEKGNAYTPGVLIHWDRVWIGKDDKRHERPLFDAAREVVIAGWTDSLFAPPRASTDLSPAGEILREIVNGATAPRPTGATS